MNKLIILIFKLERSRLKGPNLLKLPGKDTLNTHSHSALPAIGLVADLESTMAKTDDCEKHRSCQLVMLDYMGIILLQEHRHNSMDQPRLFSAWMIARLDAS